MEMERRLGELEKRACHRRASTYMMMVMVIVMMILFIYRGFNMYEYTCSCSLCVRCQARVSSCKGSAPRCRSLQITELQEFKICMNGGQASTSGYMLIKP
eukprot:631452-Karenia_brevis.AAC.1